MSVQGLGYKGISPNINIYEPLQSELVERFRLFWLPRHRVCYYPSSGSSIGSVFTLEGEDFFFSDYSFSRQPETAWIRIKQQIPDASLVELNSKFLVFKEGNKRGYFFFFDNNQVIDLLHKFGVSLQTYVGVCDGCVEGGNVECTNNWPFVEKVVLSSDPKGMDYFVDHSDFLTRFPEYIFKDRRILFMDIDKRYFNKFPIGPTRHYRVTLHLPEIYKWQNSTLCVTLEHDNIFNHLSELDGAICSHFCKLMIERTEGLQVKQMIFERGKFFCPIPYKNWTADDSLWQVFKYAGQYKWNTVGVTAFGQGMHENFLNIFKMYNCVQPLWVRIFHLDLKDFGLLKKSFKQII